MAMKYIILRKKVRDYQNKDTDQEQVVCFSGPISHKSAVPRGIYKADLVAAGFFHVEKGSVRVWAEPSETLKLGPREQDAELIQLELDRPHVILGHLVDY